MEVRSTFIPAVGATGREGLGSPPQSLAQPPPPKSTHLQVYPPPKSNASVKLISNAVLKGGEASANAIATLIYLHAFLSADHVHRFIIWINIQKKWAKFFNAHFGLFYSKKLNFLSMENLRIFSKKLIKFLSQKSNVEWLVLK